MEWQAWLTVALTVGTLLTLMLSRISPEIVMMGVLTVLAVTGVLTPNEALAGFSNAGLVTVAAMFVVAAGIQASGGVDLFVHHILGRPQSERRAQLRMALPVIGLSGFLNNTPVVAALIPALNHWSKRINVAPSALMMPLSYAAILGGTLTLIGTSTNLVVDGQYQQLTGKPGFGLFDIFPVGAATAAAGLLFILLFFSRLLPPRESPDETFADPREYTIEVAVAINGPLVGKTIAEAGLRNLQRVYLVEIEREGSIVTAVPTEERLRGGDRLVFAGDTEAIMMLHRINGLIPSIDDEAPAISKATPERRLVEAVVSAQCDCVGQTIRDARFRDRYGAVVLAVARNGKRVAGNLGSIQLRPADTLLLEARPAFVSRQRYTRDFLLINDIDEERPRHERAWLAWGILLAVVLVAATDLVSMLNASLLGAGAMLATRCCSVAQARRALDLPVLITIGASFALGTAIQTSGLAAIIATNVLAAANGNPWLLLLLVYLVVSMLTEVVTNNAAALMMLPIVLAMTSAAGLNDVPYVMAVMMAASASFATPLGYQTNMMVYGPGGYRFSDFLRVGIPMNLVACAATVLVIPLVWSLKG
jgi:di/tricarboxylate transporter